MGIMDLVSRHSGWLDGWMDGWRAYETNTSWREETERISLYLPVSPRFSSTSFSSFMIYVTSGTAKGYPSVEDCKWNLSLGLL